MPKEYPETFAVDGEAMAEAIREVIVSSSLAGRINWVERGAVGFGGRVTEFSVDGVLPPAAWSSGERLLWQTLCSIGGTGEVNLAEVFGWLSAGRLSGRLLDVFSLALIGRTT